MSKDVYLLLYKFLRPVRYLLVCLKHQSSLQLNFQIDNTVSWIKG